MESMDILSPREKEVIRLLLQGKGNKQIAHELGISERTVEFHLNNIFEKMEVKSRVELILKLGKSTGDFSEEPVESTVAGSSQTGHTGKQTDTPSRPSEVHDEKVSGEKKEFAMNTKWTTILPPLVILMGLVLISAGIVTQKYAAVVIGIICSGAAAYNWISVRSKS